MGLANIRGYEDDIMPILKFSYYNLEFPLKSCFSYCALFPNEARALVSISSAARSTPFAIALRSLQREMIRKDPAWLDGNYTTDAIPVQGMRLARKLGMITYRSAKEWLQRFGRERANAERKPGDPFGIDFEVESYLENHAVKFIGQFDPNCYLYISRAMDLFDLADHGGSVALLELLADCRELNEDDIAQLVLRVVRDADDARRAFDTDVFVILGVFGGHDAAFRT